MKSDRNHNGDQIVGYTKSFINATNNQMELMALLKGLIIIEQLNLIPIEINTDSIEIIKILIDNNLLYVGIVDDYRYMLRGLGNPVV